MISKKLHKARSYELQKGAEIEQKERPLFHISPYIGWMNDVNGFSWFNGAYHIFYQYNPYDTVWGPMHWGHVVSENLIDWKYLPAALAPDSKADEKGCFSGCAIPARNGSLALFYTGVHRGRDESGRKADVQEQMLAYGDGLNFKKVKRNPVLTGDILKNGWSLRDFRDPKIVIDGFSYKVFCVNRNEKGLGQIISFVSRDLENWRFDKVVLENDGNHGIMWECPDYITVEGQNILLFSIQNQVSNDVFTASNIVTYVLEDEELGFSCENIQQLDYGIDFYAHQTVTAPDGRIVLIAWLQNWDTCGYRNAKEKWFGQGTIPRELSVQNGKLLQQPVRELEKLRNGRSEGQVICLQGKPVAIDGIHGVHNDVLIEAECMDCSISQKIQVHFFKKENNYLLLEYDFMTGEVVLDRTHCGSDKAFQHRVCRKYERLNSDLNRVRIRCIQDRNSVEVFFGEGELVLSMAVYNREIRNGISFYADSAVHMNIVAYKLEKSE